MCVDVLLAPIQLRVSVGKRDQELALINTKYMFGKGTGTQYYCVCLCVGRGNRVLINSMCVCG